MGEEQISPERKQAQLKMREALQIAKGRKADRAVEVVKEVMQLDPTWVEPRQWLAEHYARSGQQRLAVEMLEELLRLEPENDRLWKALEELDSAAAERLRRLHDVAPDPFVAQRAATAAVASDFDELGGQDEGFVDTAPAAGGAPFAAGHPPDTDLLVEEEAEEYYAEPLPWEHDQDREYRDKLEASDAFIRLLDGFAALWDDEGAWQDLLEGCQEPVEAGVEELIELNERAAVALEAEPPRVLVSEAAARLPLVLPLAESTVIVGADARETFTNREMVFWLAWACHNLLSGAGEYAWACEAMLAHETPTSDLEVRVNETAAGRIEAWNEGLSQEDLTELAKLCQAWEQRAVLSADRAGLLAVEEEVIARRAMAGAAADRKAAPDITATEFLGHFRSLETRELARISLKQNPWTDPQYAAYRSHVIRWWATTDDYRKLAGG